MPPAKTGCARMSVSYVLDDQIGFIPLRVSQRHTGIFVGTMNHNLTPTQFATLAKLHEKGPSTQNHLGRMTAMDAATIKGVVDRLRKQGLIGTRADPGDGRRMLVELTDKGKRVIAEVIPTAHEITQRTLHPLSKRETETLLKFLKKLS